MLGKCVLLFLYDQQRLPWNKHTFSSAEIVPLKYVPNSPVSDKSALVQVPLFYSLWSSDGYMRQ